jgi:hypothetical protein
MTSNVALAMGASAFGYLVGGAVAYYLTKRHYEKRIAEEVRSALQIKARIEEKRARVHKQAAPIEEPEPVNTFREFVDAERRENVVTLGDAIVHSDRIVKDDFDWEKELPKRTMDEPYVITVDEFNLEESEYDKISLEYYEKEDVVLADRMEPMDDVDLLIGNENLTKFGYGSKDPRIVYVRNDNLETDWEIRIMQGSYVADVLGYVEHSDKVKTPKFRREEE